MLDMLIQLLGAIAVYGLVFIVLFAIVEFIPILKLFPKVKYIVPFCIGTTLFLFFAFDAASRAGALGYLAILVVCGLALWYAVGGVRSARKKLKALAQGSVVLHNGERPQE